jgi:hypothetical protein
VNHLAQKALSIRYSTPARTVPDAATPLVRLKAQDLTGANNAPVASWSDQATGDSFNGSVSQSTAANRPTLLTNVLNGKSVVSFDGNDLLVSSSINSLPNVGNGLTVIAVATADASGNTAQRLGQVGSRAGTNGKMVGFDVSNTDMSTSNGGAGFRFNNGASLYDTPISDNGFHIVAWQVDDAQAYAHATMFVDGTLPANTFRGSSTNTTSTTSFSGTDLEVILGTGRNNSGELLGSDHFTGQLAEFLVFNEQLSLGQINLVASYLSNEYALPFAYQTNLVFPEAALVGDHNHDGAVDAADYILWRETGVNGPQGYLDWRANFGGSVFSAGASTGSLASQVPEPATITMGIVALAYRFRRFTSKRHYTSKSEP